MERIFASKTSQGFDWIDLTDPTTEEIQAIAKQFSLHETSIKDCMQPDHLPKYETVDNYTFIIFRVFTKQAISEADTIQELTNKIALFFTSEYMITVHRSEQPLIDEVKAKAIDEIGCKDTLCLLNRLIRAALLTFEEPSMKLSKSLDYFEENVFLKQRKAPILRGLYYVKRKVDVMRRLLILSYEIIDKIDTPKQRNIYTRDLRDLYIRMQNIYDNLSENTAQLLSAYFSIASHRTNEIMRVLTIFSVFFMPLTFVVGVYGMNFHFMPELDWYFGYPLIMLVMAIITLAIYAWFKKKGWL
ncbi:magnesium transporter CorA family protein [Olivibacter domesticus]|uniref:Magnesium transporter n=1 Tax=Olivibacter domesticus TaxID=407022 RepID=A0A1H7YTV7_OLID1|nr:CorA family divalent cation transporter [Olivibacter domesticus]SEM49304.1 magnesium transporter [Olivibacter domesticus]